MKILQHQCGSGRSSNHSDNFFQIFFYELAGEIDPFWHPKRPNEFIFYKVYPKHNLTIFLLTLNVMCLCIQICHINQVLPRNSLKLMHDNAPSHSVEGTIGRFHVMYGTFWKIFFSINTPKKGWYHQAAYHMKAFIVHYQDNVMLLIRMMNEWRYWWMIEDIEKNSDICIGH